MVTIEKRGNSYRSTVSNGYDVNGKQIRERMAWTPEPGMTKHQIEKELARQTGVSFKQLKSGQGIAQSRAAYLDEPDARRLLELLQEERILWRAVITFDLLPGLRRAEFLGLRWCGVDLDERMIYVRQTWNYISSEGCYVDTPKSATSKRPLRISRTAVLLLLEYKRWQDAQREALGDAWLDTDGRVFTNEEGKPMFPDAVTQWFTKFVKRTGLPKVTLHSLRHTYASLMIADGAPLVVVSHNLGHAQTSTTSNIYSHVIAAAEAKADQVFDRFSGLVTPESEHTSGVKSQEVKKKAAGS